MYAKRLSVTEGEITRTINVAKKGKTERKYGETNFFLAFTEQRIESNVVAARRMQRWAQKHKSGHLSWSLYSQETLVEAITWLSKAGKQTGLNTLAESGSHCD